MILTELLPEKNLVMLWKAANRHYVKRNLTLLFCSKMPWEFLLREARHATHDVLLCNPAGNYIKLFLYSIGLTL